MKKNTFLSVWSLVLEGVDNAMVSKTLPYIEGLALDGELDLWFYDSNRVHKYDDKYVG